MLTLGEARNSTLKNIAGVAANSPAFAEYVNEATQRFLKRGDWPGTVIPIHVCVRRGCVTWPRFVKNVRALNTCRHETEIKGVWYDFIGHHHHDHWQHAWCGRRLHMIGQTHAPTYSDVYGDGRTLRFYLTNPIDTNKRVTVWGLDNNGEPLGDGYGVTVALRSPYVETNVYVRSIDRVLKDETVGRVRLYANNAGTLEDLAVYESTETSPSYARYRLMDGLTGTCSTGSCSTSDVCSLRSVVALIKLAYVPVKYDSDQILIDDLSAIKEMIQAIRFGESGDAQNAAVFESRAVREGNLAQSEDNPLDQIVVNNDPFAGVHIGGQQLF